MIKKYQRHCFERVGYARLDRIQARICQVGAEAHHHYTRDGDMNKQIFVWAMIVLLSGLGGLWIGYLRGWKDHESGEF